MPTRKQKHVGLMVDPLHGYGARILNGISRWVRSNPGWRIAFFDGEHAQLIKQVREWQGDGIICTLIDDEFVDAASSRDIPVVNVAGRTQPSNIASVLADDVACGRLAANYFLDRGFSKFAFVGNAGPLFAEERASGYIDHLKQKGHEVAVYQSDPGPEPELLNWVKTLELPTAIFCSSDRRAASVIESCWQAGLRVPEDISVLGVGDHTQLCDLCTPTLSSVDLDMEARGYEASSLLFRLLSGDPSPTRPVRITPAGIVTRRSTDSYSYDDPDLINALRFIHDHADKSIKVRDVVAATQISRRSLENRFSKYFSRSLHEEIWRVHFERAKQLLTTTDFSLQEIAERSGFRTASALANLFKQKTGLTPRTYRAEHRR